MRALRAVKVFGQIRTAEAQRLLKALANGVPGARLTEDVRASLERLHRRSASPWDGSRDEPGAAIKAEWACGGKPAVVRIRPGRWQTSHLAVREVGSDQDHAANLSVWGREFAIFLTKNLLASVQALV